jgi:hypothetical protein
VPQTGLPLAEYSLRSGISPHRSAMRAMAVLSPTARLLRINSPSLLHQISAFELIPGDGSKVAWLNGPGLPPIIYFCLPPGTVKHAVVLGQASKIV